MALQDKTIRVKRMIETIIRRTIKPSWKFPNSEMIELYLEKNLLDLPKVFGLTQISDERIVDYIVYQLYRCRSNIENGGWKSTWLFAQYAIDKFKSQFLSENGKSGMNYYIDKWLDEAELSRGRLVDMIAEPKPSPLRNMIYMESEESIKQRFYNTPEGLALCQASTTGWSPLSQSCDGCVNLQGCMELTKKKYPKLMQLRQEYNG